MRSYDDIARQLGDLRVSAGVSYRELVRRIEWQRRSRGVVERTTYNAVYRCLQPGRSRLDGDLVADIAYALTADPAAAAAWQRAHECVATRRHQASVVTVSATAPAPLDDFVGRRNELKGLVRRLSAGETVVVSGMGGAGKSALAREAAQALRRTGRSDAQLWVDLRGFDPDRPPADPTAVLVALLKVLGVRPDRAAVMDRQQRTAELSRRLADRRALVVLDNAADEVQVRPLLPDPASGCAVLVTSRRTLTGLDVGSLQLGAFSEDDAAELLRSAQPSPPDVDHRKLAQLADLVGRLPLAVGMVASHLRQQPDWSLSDQISRLAELRDHGHLDACVDLALTSSYDDLDQATRRVFRLLAVHPGRTFDEYAVAAIAELPMQAAAAALNRLRERHLVEVAGAGRYRFHDLVQLLAGNKARAEESRSIRDRSLDRLRRYYLYAAYGAVSRYAPAKAPTPPPAGEAAAPEFTDRTEALHWLDAERANLIECAIISGGRSALAAEFSRVLAPYLAGRAHTDDAVIVHGTAQHTSADPHQRAAAACRHAMALAELNRYDEAFGCLDEALTGYRRLGDRPGEIAAQLDLGTLCFWTGRPDEALAHSRACAQSAAALGESRLLLRALGSVARDCLRLGQVEATVAAAEECLRLAALQGDGPQEVRALAHLGHAHFQLCRPGEALRYFDRSAALARDHGLRGHETEALCGRADALRHIGDPYEAAATAKAAVVAARATGDRSFEAWALNALGAAALIVDGPITAIGHHQAALVAAEDSLDIRQEAVAHLGTANGLAKLGDPAARGHWLNALRLREHLDRHEAGQIEDLLSS